MIIGAGEGAVSVLSELAKSPWNEYIPVCIVDDDKEKLNRRISGVKVAGTTYATALALPLVAAKAGREVGKYQYEKEKKNDYKKKKNRNRS